MDKKYFQFFLFLLIISSVALFFIFDFHQFLTLEIIKAKQGELHDFYIQNQQITWLLYFMLYVLITALSLPGAAVMTLAAGALFGVFTATILVSFASTLGATLAFLSSRFLFHDFVQNRYREKLLLINEGIRKEGIFYLFTLRLVPLFPFFIINIVMGLTPIRTLPYFIVSQVGMFPGTIVYVFAGTQLAKIDSLEGILSPNLIFAFTLLGVFPLLTKKAITLLRQRKNEKKK